MSAYCETGFSYVCVFLFNYLYVRSICNAVRSVSITVFWDLTAFNMIVIYQRFGGTYYLHRYPEGSHAEDRDSGR
jgi:hypothetical protein